MQKQVDMEKSMLLAHRNFMENLEKSLAILEEEIGDVKALRVVCSHDWRMMTEQMIDELHKYIFSISEPRFAEEEDHQRLKELRKRMKDLYIDFTKALAVQPAK